jgi:hypothetical protein
MSWNMALLGMRRERNFGQKATRSLLVIGFIGSLAACSNATNSDSSASTTDSSPGTSVDGADSVQPTCDQPGVLTCLLPWPDNRLTVPDLNTPTGRRLAIPSDATPINVEGVALDVTDQNRGDGFSPNSVIVFAAPDVDLAKSGVPNSTAIEDSLSNSNPISLRDIDSETDWPFWGELDEPSGLVTLRPAVALTEGHTYQVTIGALVTNQGQLVDIDANKQQWSFTVASKESLSSRLLYERSVAYEQIGDGAPKFTVDTVTPGDVQTIDGTLEIPNFLDNDGSPGGKLLFDSAGNPSLNPEHPSYDAAFRCVIPNEVSSPVPALLYGHGLLGSRSQVDFFGAFAGQGMIGACAVDWLGMATEDVANLAGILNDMSRFNEQADRMLQGIIAFQMLGRLTNSQMGFVSHPAFQNDDGSPIFQADATVFVGNSQGGILGGAATAISSEWSRAVLGVPGMNYSLLLPRSSDWPQFQVIFDKAYTKPEDQIVALALVQLLWDRGENGGYAQHLTADPYPGLEVKNVLLVEAFGDHQVANVATEVFARTIQAKLGAPALQDGRSLSKTPFWGIEPIDGYPFDGSALVVWDYGTPAPPVGAAIPTDPEYGRDPHGAGSDEPLVLVQALGYLLGGQLLNVCGDGPCIGTQIDG